MKLFLLFLVFNLFDTLYMNIEVLQIVMSTYTPYSKYFDLLFALSCPDDISDGIMLNDSNHASKHFFLVPILD